uniref:Uncharacterized protein n=1 Tax=Haliotis diversicolor TaxID=36095 RepID=B3TK42_HALDV|nr:unknown protein 7 [Haliotis diversicolor]
MANLSLLAIVAVAMMVVVPQVHGRGGSCWAPPIVYGATCTSDSSIFGSPGYKAHYTVSVNGNAGTLVCCDGLFCDNTGCSMMSIGCVTPALALPSPGGTTPLLRL